MSRGEEGACKELSEFCFGDKPPDRNQSLFQRARGSHFRAWASTGDWVSAWDPAWVSVSSNCCGSLERPDAGPPAGARCGSCRPGVCRVAVGLFASQTANRRQLWRLWAAPRLSQPGAGPPLPSRGARVPPQPPPQLQPSATAPHHRQLPRQPRVSSPALSRRRLDGGGRRGQALDPARGLPGPLRHSDWLKVPPVTD